MNIKRIIIKSLSIFSIFVFLLLMMFCESLFDNKKSDNDEKILLAMALLAANNNTTFSVKQIGVADSYTAGYSISMDTNDNVYITGYTSGGLDGNNLTGRYDVFLIKYDSSGNKKWTKQMGTTSADVIGRGIATDSNKYVYIAGETSHGLDGNTQSGSNDVFLIKYDLDGNKQWTKQMGITNSSTVGYGVSTDSNGNVYVAGTTTGGLDGNTLTGTKDVFLIKYDSNGNKQWTRQLGVANSDTVGFGGVSTDSSGNVYIAGYTTGGLDGNTLTGNSDFFVIKYDLDGNRQWTKQMGANSSDTSSFSVSTDSNGNVYIAGPTTNGLDGNTQTGSIDAFVIKYDSSGNKQWAKQIGVANSNTIGRCVSIDFDNNIYVTGSTDGGLEGNTLTGTKDVFLIKYNSSGNKQWTKQMGANSSDTTGYSTSTDSSGNVYVTGTTKGGLDGNTLIGNSDAIIIKYDTNGNKK